jgi:DUF4097 and DUF4098 domain-containing protein YvlB
MTLIHRLTVACAAFVLAAPAGQTVGIGAVPVSAQTRPDDGDERTDKWSRVFKVPQKGALELSNLAGDVVIAGGGGDEIVVEATKRVEAGSPEQAREQLESLGIRVNETAGRVEISTAFPHGHRGTRAEVDFRIRVPQHVGVNVHTVAGDVRLEKVQGEVRAQTVSGNLVVTDVPHLTEATTVSGNLTITGSRGSGVKGGTVSGDLVAKGLAGDSCNLQSVSGAVTLTDARCQHAQLRSMSGDVQYSGTVASGGRYEFNSHSGDVLLTVTGGSGFELVAKTFSGDLRSDVEFAARAGDEGGRRGRPDRQLRGTIGDGSAYVVVKTFSGSVHVAGASTGRPARR